MARRTDAEAAFHKRRWGKWFDEACESLKVSSTAMARKLSEQKGDSVDEFAGVSSSRVGQWRKGDANVEPETAFRIGQKLARLYNRLDLAGPFAVFGAGYLVDGIDILRRIAVLDASACYAIMQKNSKIPLSLDEAVTNDDFEAERVEALIGSFRSATGLLEQFEAAWRDALDPRGSAKKWLVGYAKNEEGFITATMVDVENAKDIVRRGEHQGDIPMVKRFYAAETIMNSIVFLTGLFGPEEAYNEGHQMLERWILRFDRSHIMDDREFSMIKDLLKRYGASLREFAVSELKSILDQYGAKMDSDCPFYIERDPYVDEAGWLASSALEATPTFYALLTSIFEEGAAIQNNLEYLGNLPNVFGVTLPNLTKNKTAALPRLSAIAAEIWAQVRGFSDGYPA
jgi:transcriptional regulator with XRE-family HTH domain